MNPLPVLRGLLLVSSLLVVGSRLGAQAVSAAPVHDAAAPVHDAAAEREALVATVTGLDKKLFDAYNTCDLKTLGAMVSEDLEFYHDLTGLAVGRQVFVEAIRNNICGKVTRELVPGKLEVYPLKGYGAVEMGTHRFHHPGKENDDVGEARFVTLWRYKDGVWMVTRVISYEHGAAK